MDTEHQIRSYIVDNFLFGDGEELTSSQSLLESGVVDSTGIMELIMFLEKTFRIKVADEDLVPENLDTIGSIAKYVASKLANRAA